MTIKHSSVKIVIADDDEEDCMLAKEALRECHLSNPIDFVHDGEELLKYLRQRKDEDDNDAPGLILLDLNMPRMNGYEALREIKADPDLRKIPIIILTTSKDESDIVNSYDLGANSFITKPVSFDALVDTMLMLKRYWFEIVELPGNE